MAVFGAKYVIFTFLVGYVVSEQNNIIRNITSTIVREFGEEAVLSCIVDNPKDYSVLWTKKGLEKNADPVVLSYQNQAIKDPRFNLIATNTNYSLLIKDIEFSDAALYECQVVVSPTIKETARVELLIKHPPKITESIQVTPTPAKIGQSAELKCIADGYPRPSISWVREYDAILPAGGNLFQGNILKINEVEKQDRGLYYCIADNGIGKPDRRAVNFEVEFSPKIVIPRPRVAQAIDYDIELECRVEAYPAPTVVWFKNGVQLYSEGDYSITNTATIHEITISILRVITIDPEQYGDYVCKASNSLGSVEERVNLFEQYLPDINFSGLQWNSTISPFHHLQFIINYLILSLIAIVLLY